MENLEEIINHQLQLQIHGIRNKNLYPFMDFVLLERILRELIPSIADIVSKIVEERSREIRELQAELNQVSFASNPERDKKIIDLFNQGLSKRKIANLVRMTPWGITKALRRLGQLG